MVDGSLSIGCADLLIRSVTGYAILALDRDGVVASWNAGAERLYGYRSEEIVGAHLSRFYAPEDRAAGSPDAALASASTSGLFEAEGWRVRKDGARFWANVAIEPIRDESGVLAGFAMIARDSTEQMKTEEELRKSEERFRLLVQGVTDYAIYMLDPEGRVSSWNAGAERFKGYSEREIIGQDFSRFYPPEDRAAGVPQKALSTAASEGRFEAEGWRLRKDGSRFWAHVVIDPIRSEGGVLLGYTKITRDLTERKIAEEALEQSREQLHQAQKMDAIGQLTGGVAHDFNNLLAAIMGGLRLAQRRQENGEDGAGFINSAIEAAERGAALTQRMLAFARKQKLKLEPTDILGSLNETTELLQRTIGQGITIRTDFPRALDPVLTDRVQLELAVMNLAVNARDAMPKGGEIIFRARAVEPNAEGETFIRLSIEDQGEGMDKETLTRATEPFFTTKDIGKGTGLGLSMVKGIVEQSGGRLVLRSEIQRGTTAEIWLPVAAPSAESAPEKGGEAPVNGAKLRILVVDDEPIVLLNTVLTLTDMGHVALEAHSGGVALEILEREDVDLLITDFAMPKMMGAELIERARAVKPDLKVIIASGYSDLPEGAAVEAHRLPKPFTEQDLAKAIAAVGDQHAAHVDARAHSGL
ncbi:PAS domain S-box protein [Pikeienuella sp. HZG-20]|uniref:hybrid sensor histidine kinase/response regulator n=1 Tax=Paludibacillus litoralis TaxID=3133267 RepID=UPI0030EC4CC0